MKLITKPISTILQNNWRQNAAHEARYGATPRCKPALKLFTPWRNATWLITEQKPDDPDLLFGLCDLGHGCPELGYVRLSDLERLARQGGITVERDIHFAPEFYLDQYLQKALAAGHVMT